MSKETPMSDDMKAPERALPVRYTNYRGETAIRTVEPRFLILGSTEHHPEEQWLLEVFDHEKRAVRTYALKDCDFAQADLAARVRACIEPAHASDPRGIAEAARTLLEDVAWFLDAEPDPDRTDRGRALDEMRASAEALRAALAQGPIPEEHPHE